MTCIAAWIDKDEVVMGCDSAGVNSEYDLEIRPDSKVFVQGPFIIGYTSSFRMGQILQYDMVEIPDVLKDTDTMKFMVNKFVPFVRAALSQSGWEKKVDFRAEGGNFLVGYEGRIFIVYSDYSVSEETVPFNSCGCAHGYAMGAMEVMNTYAYDTGQTVERKIEIALNVAERFSAGVRSPFKILRGGKKSQPIKTHITVGY